MKNLLLSVIITGMLFSVSAQEKYHSEALEEVADIGKSMAMRLSVNSDNRVFVAFPNYDGDGRYALTEISSGMLRPYPDKGWNTKKNDDRHFLRIQDLYADAEDRLWVLDSRPDGKKHTLVRDSRILWPDSLGIGTDGYLYFTCAQMQRLPQWNKGLVQ